MLYYSFKFGVILLFTAIVFVENVLIILCTFLVVYGVYVYYLASCPI